MRFYNITNDYISFLSTYDTRVPYNKDAKRPYVGVILDVHGIKYYAPFTSPKPKHLHMHNTKDFRKIGQGRFGAVNLNNMLPVPDEALLPKDIDHEPDLDYRNLLWNQYNALLEDFPNIQRAAEELRRLVFTDDNELTSNDRKIKQRCCNLPLLESVYIRYPGQ